jgi:hypothetical protein
LGVGVRAHAGLNAANIRVNVIFAVFGDDGVEPPQVFQQVRESQNIVNLHNRYFLGFEIVGVCYPLCFMSLIYNFLRKPPNKNELFLKIISLIIR